MKKKNLSGNLPPKEVYEWMIAVLFGQRPVEDLGEIICDSFLGYGTAAHEFFRNRAEVAEMVHIQVDQLANQAYDFTDRKSVV